MKRYYFIIILAAFSLYCGCESPVKIDVTLAPGYPKWLMDTTIVAQQTSGIAFIGSTAESKIFIIADDIGKLHRFTITNDSIFSFTTLQFSPQAEAKLKGFPKADFEDLAYDKKKNQLFLSVEGNGDNYRDFTKIFKVEFSGDILTSNRVTNLVSLNITPQDVLLQYTGPNSGFEGLAVDDRYLYLGLEGFKKNILLSDSTLIYVVDKKSLTIHSTISTSHYGIGSITGLYTNGKGSLFVLDRNNRKLVHLQLSDKREVISYSSAFLDNPVPGYPERKYIMALESLTFDDEGNAYLIDDPWTSFFVPGEETLSQLDSVTVQRYKSFVPIIFKYATKMISVK